MHYIESKMGLCIRFTVSPGNPLAPFSRNDREQVGDIASPFMPSSYTHLLQLQPSATLEKGSLFLTYTEAQGCGSFSGSCL